MNTQKKQEDFAWDLARSCIWFFVLGADVIFWIIMFLLVLKAFHLF